MSTINTLNPNDTGATSRSAINANFTNLNADKIETSVLDTDVTLAANSDSKVATQKAVKTYVDTELTNAFSGVRVYQNAAANISSETLLSFQLENFDTDTYHSTISNTERLTVPAGKAGKYIIGGNLSINLGYESQIIIRLNGTTNLARSAGGANTNFFGASTSTIYDLAEGDYVEILAKGANAGATTSGDALTNFWMYKIN